MKKEIKIIIISMLFILIVLLIIFFVNDKIDYYYQLLEIKQNEFSILIQTGNLDEIFDNYSVISTYNDSVNQLELYKSLCFVAIFIGICLILFQVFVLVKQHVITKVNYNRRT